MGKGGDVFVLDMGESVKIIDLARQMIRLSGLDVKDAANPKGDIEIRITGLRPGEKLYEELIIGDNAVPTGHPRILTASETMLPWPQLETCWRNFRLPATAATKPNCAASCSPPQLPSRRRTASAIWCGRQGRKSISLLFFRRPNILSLTDSDGTFFASRLETSNAPEKSIRHYQPLPSMRLDTKSPVLFRRPLLR